MTNTKEIMQLKLLQFSSMFIWNDLLMEASSKTNNYPRFQL